MQAQDTRNTQDHDLLRRLASELRKTHKLLLQCQSALFGEVGSPFDHLQLVTNHPDFAWLRMLSEFMVQIDERIDDEQPLQVQELVKLRAAAEGLIGPAAPSAPVFREKYLEALHTSPELTIQHGALKLALGKLPQAQ